MISRILIANRGEIALRIVRACRDLGIHSVVAYSEADHDTLAAQLADEAICIGPASSGESYLKIDRLVAAAEVCDVDAIHPGYGFLAENAHFAEVCEECKITFIGPSPHAIRGMGDKANARDTMRKAGVPITPGSNGILRDEKAALECAHEMGYPVMIKASAGGGGKGMRVVHNDASLVKNYHAARSESEMAFGSGDVYLEKFIVNPRHVEIQILADAHGNVIHLGERDCSLQRRHQKLIEESPCPIMDSKLRDKMGAAAVKAAKAVDYVNAGTVEFLLGADGKFYFMEMNTRIQVEHPVTEMVTGIDLIKEQIRIAAGEKLPVSQSDVVMDGHAIEVRINAENPARNFAPCPGKINLYSPPGGPGVRVDSHVYQGYVVPPTYDSMIGKLIVHGRDRSEALARCSRALYEYTVEGVHTTIDFAAYVINREDVVRGDYHTGYLEHLLEMGWFEEPE
ncbi:MAG: acetyl-CoA carboxylase biotin carboxylase subunit [Candidatus Pacebacteria bacterium]|nr:acetyl-CoA carboxylase biotin carboxylase subunit [Candidatus Paceibacterota bacterium]